MVAKTFAADSVVNLHCRRGGSGPPVVLLHGLFGSGGNLGALGRALQEEFTVYAVDLPGHGRSDWLTAYSLSHLTQSLHQWMMNEGLSCAHLVGHSLGAKVAMQLALSFGQCVSSLTVADIAPVAYPGSHESVFNALQAVASSNCASRAAAHDLMRQYLEEEGVIQFLLGSLQRDPAGRYVWRLDLAGLRRDYSALLAAPAARDAYTGPVLFIKGADSDYIQASHSSAIEKFFPAAALKVMSDCGHWLHVQNPVMFNGLVQRFLLESAASPQEL